MEYVHTHMDHFWLFFKQKHPLIHLDTKFYFTTLTVLFVHSGRLTNDISTHILMYADDLCLVSESIVDMQKKIKPTYIQKDIPLLPNLKLFKT